MQYREERGQEVSNAKVEESAKAAADIFQAADPVLVRSAFELIRPLLEEGGPVPAEKVASRLQISHDEATILSGYTLCYRAVGACARRRGSAEPRRGSGTRANHVVGVYRR